MPYRPHRFKLISDFFVPEQIVGGKPLNMFIFRFSILSLLAFVYVSSSFAQQKPDHDMGKMQMIFLTRLPERRAEAHATKIKEQHQAYIENLIKDSRLALWGEVTTEGPLREILVMKTESIEEAKQLAMSLPSVKEGMLKAEVLSWYGARDLIKTAKMPLTKEGYIFGLLVRGPKWTKEQTEQTKKLQEGHMANINRLAEAGKLVLAGPFYEDGNRRGVFIFKVETEEEAMELTQTDPAVRAGRLKIELYGWKVPKGMLQ
jgi:uncharacterized protein YciI